MNLLTYEWNVQIYYIKWYVLWHIKMYNNILLTILILNKEIYAINEGIFLTSSQCSV